MKNWHGRSLTDGGKFPIETLVGITKFVFHRLSPRNFLLCVFELRNRSVVRMFISLLIPTHTHLSCQLPPDEPPIFSRDAFQYPQCLLLFSGPPNPQAQDVLVHLPRFPFHPRRHGTGAHVDRSCEVITFSRLQRSSRTNHCPRLASLLSSSVHAANSSSFQRFNPISYVGVGPARLFPTLRSPDGSNTAEEEARITHALL